MSDVLALVVLVLVLVVKITQPPHDDSPRLSACATLPAAMADDASPDPAPDVPRSPAARTLAGIAQLGALAVGIVYMIGVLIVNLNLGQYGIISLDLARPEYALAGALWAFLTLAALWGVQSSLAVFRRFRWDRPGQWVLLGMAVVFSWFAPVLIALGGSGYSPGTDAPWWVRYASGLLLVITGASVYRIGRICMALSKDPLPLLDAATGQLDRMFSIVPFSFVVLLGLYAAVVYPDIPREVGGGRRPTVEVVLAEATPIDWKAAGVPFSADTKTAGPVMLLLDTPGSLVVVRPETWREREFFRIATSARVIALDRKLVAAVVYLPRGALSPSPSPPSGAPPPSKPRADPS
jgi:hypothetical protein